MSAISPDEVIARPVARSSEFVPELGGIRGCAILMVLLFHLAPELPQNRYLQHIFKFGWSGVDLFFALSGFLITGILMRARDGEGYFKNFYFRRSLRIFPVYYWSLAIATVVFTAVPALNSSLPAPHDRLMYWFYLSNWTPLMLALNQRAFGHFWSLAIEEQFYWMWPFVVRFVPPRRLIVAAVTAFLIALLLRISIPSHWFILRNTFCRMDSLMAGAICAIAYQSASVRRWLIDHAGRLVIPMLTLILIAVAADWRDGGRFLDTIGLSSLAMSYGILLLYAMNGAPWFRSILSSVILARLGLYSYGLYVYHQILYFAFKGLHVVRDGWPMFILTMGVSISLAAASYELIEKRILSLKNRQRAVPVKDVSNNRLVQEN